MELFPVWAQEAYWDLIDTMRLSTLLADRSKDAIQVNLTKEAGGYRPLVMLEETLKAVEGPVARRRVSRRSSLVPGHVYSQCNLAGEAGCRAAQEVMYGDALICEDAMAFQRPFSRVPSDLEKFFNAIQAGVVASVDEIRGVPDAARDIAAECLCDLRVKVPTRWGLAPAIRPTRGFPQGACSSPESSKPAQEPILRLRESSPAAYVTSAGRRVEAFGYVDDIQNYGQGLPDLLTIIQELSFGSRASGIGLSWANFSAFSTGWDEAIASGRSNHGDLAPGHVTAQGWNIWSGALATAAVPRARADEMEKLMDKRGSIRDKHSAAAQDTIVKVAKVRRALSHRRCSWDEVCESLQIVVRGVLGYAPLVGIPEPGALHSEDQAFQRLILQELRVRNRVEKVSLLAPLNAGGVQAPSIVECMVGAVARDILILLAGQTRCAQLARDSAKQAMEGQWPRGTPDGLVSRAFNFLAGYGIYITLSTDRTTGRILDVIQGRACCHGHPMVGRFSDVAFRAGMQFSRVNALSINIRRIVNALHAEGVPLSEWH